MTQSLKKAELSRKEVEMGINLSTPLHCPKLDHRQIYKMVTLKVCQVPNNLMNLFVSVDSPQSSNQNQSGNVTDEEVELKQNISRSRNPSSDMMIEEPRSRVPVKSVHERGRVYSNEMLNSVNAGDSMGAKSKHAVSINNDPLIGDKVKHASPDRRSRLPSSATKSEANLQKNENDCNLLLSQANSTKVQNLYFLVCQLLQLRKSQIQVIHYENAKKNQNKSNPSPETYWF